MHTACRAKEGETRPQLKNWAKTWASLLLDSHNGSWLEFKEREKLISIFEIVKCCVKSNISWKQFSWNDCDFNLLRNFWFRDPDPDVVSALCSRVLYVGLMGGVVVGLEYSGDPHPPTHSYRGTLEVESCAGAIPPPCTTCYNATIAPPCKHPEGGWVLVGAGGCSPCGRRVPRHPPTQTAQYTARHVPASAGPRRARPGRPPGGEHSCGPRGWRGSTFAGCKCKLGATFCWNSESCGKL